MPKAVTSRHPLPTSSTDFNLPSATSTPPGLGPGYLDDTSVLFQRFRRPSLLSTKPAHLPDSRLHSPLAASFKPSSSHARRASLSTSSLDDSDSLWSDISPPSSSENPTPPLMVPESTDDTRRSMPPLTPPRRSVSRGSDLGESRLLKARRLSFPLKQPRILNLLAESKPVENEVQSEAAFQRLLASGVELPRTPRTVADRGRYPEEAGHEEFQREDTPSDDGEENDSTYPFCPIPSGSEPINIRTPAGSVNGDDINTMCISESPSLSGMDVDVPSGSPSMSSMSSMMSISHWRSTPPPTTSAVRSNKRKFDDRFDPYQNASKRRAVSPSLSHLRDSHPSSPKSRSNPRLPISIPIMPASAASSTTSSPTVGVGVGTFMSMSRPTNGISSPTLRPALALASPILRPIPRRRGEEEEREIEGAGDGVGCLTLT